MSASPSPAVYSLQVSTFACLQFSSNLPQAVDGRQPMPTASTFSCGGLCGNPIAPLWVHTESGTKDSTTKKKCCWTLVAWRDKLYLTQAEYDLQQYVPLNEGKLCEKPKVAADLCGGEDRFDRDGNIGPPGLFSSMRATEVQAPVGATVGSAATPLSNISTVYACPSCAASTPASTVVVADRFGRAFGALWSTPESAGVANEELELGEATELNPKRRKISQSSASESLTSEKIKWEPILDAPDYADAGWVGVDSCCCWGPGGGAGGPCLAVASAASKTVTVVRCGGNGGSSYETLHRIHTTHGPTAVRILQLDGVSATAPLLAVCENSVVAVYDSRLLPTSQLATTTNPPPQGAASFGSVARTGLVAAVYVDSGPLYALDVASQASPAIGATGESRCVHLVDTRRWQSRVGWPSALKYACTSLAFSRGCAPPNLCYVGGIHSEFRIGSTLGTPRPVALSSHPHGPVSPVLYANASWVGMTMVQQQQEEDVCCGLTSTGALYMIHCRKA